VPRSELCEDSLAVNWLFTACSLPVHCLFTAYSLPIHYLFTACSLPVHCFIRSPECDQKGLYHRSRQQSSHMDWWFSRFQCFHMVSNLTLSGSSPWSVRFSSLVVSSLVACLFFFFSACMRCLGPRCWGRVWLPDSVAGAGSRVITGQSPPPSVVGR
jgi:hypothetical protein